MPLQADFMAGPAEGLARAGPSNTSKVWSESAASYDRSIVLQEVNPKYHSLAEKFERASWAAIENRVGGFAVDVIEYVPLPASATVLKFRVRSKPAILAC